jgi:hypothetical protein
MMGGGRSGRIGWLPVLLLVLAAALAGTAGALALSSGDSRASGISGLPTLPSNDLQDLLALTGTSTPKQAPVQDNPQPVLAPTPAAVCRAGSRPLAGEQGRVPASAIDSPAAARGWTCNLREVGHHATPGGFRVWRYVDRAGHVCAFYDTALTSPLNVVRLGLGGSPGVAVLNVADPAHPTLSTLLTTLPMRFPHESLNLNARRGLLAAEMGNGTTYPGLMSIYSVSQDCLHPTLDFTGLMARFGHESGFSPDGNTFYIGGGEGIAAIDVSDPHHPRTLWQGNVFAHGLNLSSDGNTLYDSNPIDGQLILFDVSEIQNRVKNPQVKEISRLTWDTVSIPQNTDPIEIHGKPYLLEFDEFAFRFNPPTDDDQVGAARIISLADPSHPRVVSNLRLAVNMPAAHAAADGDPDPLQNSAFTYSAHYCNVPRLVDPEIAACSFINSGLRIFNIQDPVHPREVGYFIAPPRAATTAGIGTGDFALSQPAFDPARREVWYTDATSGFYVVKLDRAIWPHPLPVAPPKPCVSPSGRLLGTELAALRLGEPRQKARRAYPRYSTRDRRDFDFYCLSGGGLRAGYRHDRIVLELTSDHYYAYHGITPGTTLSNARRHVHLGPHYNVGRNTWYLIPGRQANGVLKVRHNQVQEIGLANKTLTNTPARARRFFRSFG